MSNQLRPVNVEVMRQVPLRRDKVYDEKLLTGYIEARIETLDYLNITGPGYPIEIRDEGILHRMRELFEKSRPDQLVEEITRLSRSISLENYYPHIKHSNKPVIPGTSLKGAVRSRLELLIHSHDNMSIACFTSASPPPRKKPSPGMHGWRHMEAWLEYGTLIEVRDHCRIGGEIEYFEDISVCKICDLFGNAGLTARVYFGTFYTEPESIKELRVVFSCHKRIKGVVEAVKPGTVFKGGISFNGLTLSELGLLFIGLGLNNCPILLGRFKYKWVPICTRDKLSLVRFGRVKIGIERIKLPHYQEEQLRNLGVGFRREDIYLIVDNDAGKLVDSAIKAAYQEYGQYLPEPDNPEKCEANILEKILEREREDRLEACRYACR